jgi:hypothetical protein
MCDPDCWAVPDLWRGLARFRGTNRVPILGCVGLPIRALIQVRLAAGCRPDSIPHLSWQCGESGTVKVRFVPSRRGNSGTDGTFPGFQDLKPQRENPPDRHRARIS